MNAQLLADPRRPFSASLAHALRAVLAVAAAALTFPVGAAQPSPPFPVDACGFVRGATGCTANDTDDISVELDANFVNPTSCSAGSDVTVYLKVNVGTTATERYNLGILFSKDGKNPIVDPTTTGAQTCSAFKLPSPPFPELDTVPNTCGDQSSAAPGSFTTGAITVKCLAGPGNQLSVPYVGLWNHQTAACSTVADLVAGTSSKCTQNTQSLPITVVTPRGLTLQKTWVNGIVGNAISVTTTGLANNAAVVSISAGGNTTAGTQVFNAPGAVVTLPAETFTTGLQANYTTTVACTGATPSSSTLPATFTMPNNDVTCTYTNTRVARNLTLKKTWVNGKNGDAITATTTGLTSNASVASTSTGGNTDTGVAASNVPGGLVTLPAEVFNSGLQANYATTVACVGATLSGSTPGSTFTMPDADVTCTYTNTRVARNVTLKKTWVNGKVGDAITATTTGLTSNATVGSTSTGANTDTGSPASNVPGGLVTLPAEVFNTGLQANYTTAVACVGATLSGSTPGSTFTMPDNDVTCTYTNTRVARNLTLKKAWVNGKVGDAITATTTGLTSNATVGSTSSGGNTDTGVAASNVPGGLVTLPAEVFNTGLQANYTTTVACVGATLSGSTPGSTFTMPDADVECTYTNTRVARNLTLKKTWVNGKNGDAITATTTGLTSNATVASTSTGGNTDTGLAASNVPGAVVTLPAETFNTGLQANYTTTVACVGATLSGSTPGSTFTMPDADVTCTYTNTRVARNLTLKKTWVNGKVGDAITATTTGLTSNATVGSTSTGANTDTGSPASNVPGGLVTLPAEVFNTGLQANYTTAVACVGATLSGSTPGSTFTMPDADVECTYTNTRVSRNLTLKKAWVNGINGDAITATTTGLTSNATVGSTSTGANTDTGSPASNVPGGVVTLPAEVFNTGSQANYTTTVACVGATLSGSTPGSTFTMPDNDVTCTYTNARNARSVTLRKTWVNGKSGDAITAATTGLTSNATVSSTSSGGNTDTGTPASNVPGAVVTLPAETFNTGSQANYTTTVACTGATPSSSTLPATFTMPDADVVCTYTNTRVSRSLTLRKAWVNGKTGDAISVTTTGLANNATVSLTSTGNNSTDGTPVSNAPGATVTLPAETFTTGNALHYTTTVACTGATLSGSTPGSTFTMPDNDVTCTYTNTRRSAILQLVNVWINAVPGDQINDAASGIVNSAGVALTSVAGAANETDIGPEVTVYAGELAGLVQGAVTGSGSQYLQSFSCAGNASPVSVGNLSVTDTDVKITCTFVNERVIKAPPPGGVMVVPTMSEYGLMLMAALMALMGALATRRRRTR